MKIVEATRRGGRFTICLISTAEATNDGKQVIGADARRIFWPLSLKTRILGERDLSLTKSKPSRLADTAGCDK
jgi:hypothetical protein